MLRSLILLLALGAAMPLTAQAAIIGGWGVETFNTTASNCPSFCTTANGGQFARASDGGIGVPFASSTENTFASTRAEAQLTGNGFLPILRAEAVADAGRGGFTTAFGAQGYTYEGSIATTLRLDLSLTGIVGDNANGAFARNTITGRVGVVKASEIDFISDWATLMFEAVNQDDVVDRVSMFITDPLVRTSRGSILLNLDPGDDYFVIASLTANSQNGFARGFNTLELQYQDANGLALSDGQLGSLGLAPATGPLPVEPKPVPEPATLALLLTGLLGFVGWRRLTRAAASPQRGVALLPA